ncbi:hypothetical protein Btru_024125 [Bulinus truncatus]|nr:hypothetical protein Btru_024125 [Bulinus truncatus]
MLHLLTFSHSQERACDIYILDWCCGSTNIWVKDVLQFLAQEIVYLCQVYQFIIQMTYVNLEHLSPVTTTQWLVALVIVLVITFYFYSTSYHGVWEKVGVPGPKPIPFLDHSLELRHGLDTAYRKWFGQYGQTFGVYGVHPHKATLVTKDLSLVKEVLVKDFDNFTKRYRAAETSSSLNNGLSSTSAKTWKRHRQVLNPLFTVAKMKIMLHHINDSARNLAELIGQCVDKGELIPVKLICSKFSTEVIARVAFGVDTHSVSKEESEFAYYSRTMVNVGKRKTSQLYNFLLNRFPELINLLTRLFPPLDFINRKSDKYFIEILKSAIASRKRENPDCPKSRDILDLMMNASAEENGHTIPQADSKYLTDEEIIANSVTLTLAGVETISSILQRIIYCLAQYPDLQDRVFKEVNEVVPEHANIEYEQLHQLKYTEQFIDECLRLFPLISYIARVTSETKTYNGTTVVKGSVVQIPIGHIMVDPDHWADPHAFDPERFSPENKARIDPMSFLPFGYGPRLCLGQRLAMAELKTVLVYLLKRFKFELSARTEPKKGDTLKMELMSTGSLRPVYPVMIEAIKRV